MDQLAAMAAFARVVDVGKPVQRGKIASNSLTSVSRQISALVQRWYSPMRRAVEIGAKTEHRFDLSTALRRLVYQAANLLRFSWPNNEYVFDFLALGRCAHCFDFVNRIHLPAIPEGPERGPANHQSRR